MKKLILGLVAAAAIAAPLALAAPASAGTTNAVTPASTPISGHDDTMGDALPSYPALSAYWADYSADYSESTRANSNFTFVDSKLTVKGAYGWVTTFEFTVRTPKVPGGAHKSESSGTVTHTTDYGTGTQAFTAPVGTTAPWTIDGDNVVVQPDEDSADTILAAQRQLATANPLANAGFWFPAY